MKTYAFRLHPGQDLRAELEAFALREGIAAGAVITCVGNLTKIVARMADERIVKTFEGTFEIVSLVGTMEPGNSHLHISFSDSAGAVFGGHLKKGSLVGVTAEVVVGEIEGKKFERVYDPETGFEELVVKEVGESK